MNRTSMVFTLVVILAGALSFSGCNKKAAQATPPPPPPPVAPTATLAANPAVIQQGQSTVLTWQTDNATEATIDGLGTLPASGSRTVTPRASTTYTWWRPGREGGETRRLGSR